MLGQIRIEFIAGILIFTIIIVFIVNQTNITFSNLLTDSRTDILKSKALNTITILVEDTGEPPDWDPLNVERVGLAVKPYSLSINKINDLSADCSLLDNFILNYCIQFTNYYLHLIATCIVCLRISFFINILLPEDHNKSSY